MIYAHTLLGGSATPAMVWANDYGDGLFHEVGALLRVSFTPTVAQKYLVHANLKAKMGDGSYRSRLYCKARIVRILPTFKDDLAFYSEALVEFAGNYIRFFESSRPIFVVDDIPAENLGVVHTYGVEFLAGDGVHGEINYGSPMYISD